MTREGLDIDPLDELLSSESSVFQPSEPSALAEESVTTFARRSLRSLESDFFTGLARLLS